MFDRKKQLQWSKIRGGAVVTAALIIILITVLFAGNLESLFTPKAEITALISDVRGLRNGSPVWISGIEIGSVTGIKLSAEHGTVVTLSIRKSVLDYIREDSVATIMTMGLLGDKYVEISNGSHEAKAVVPGSIIKGRRQFEIKDVVEASSASLGKVSEIVDKFSVFIEKIEKSEGSLGKFINDPSVYNNLRDSTRSLARVLKEFESGEGSLQQMMKDKTLYSRLTSAATSLDEAGKRVTEGEGSMAKLVNDPALYDNLEKASRNLNGVLEDIEAGKGLAGALTKDEELTRQVKETLSGLTQVVGELKELTKDIKDNPKKYFKFSVF